jgi:hypothetical protein
LLLAISISQIHSQSGENLENLRILTTAAGTTNAWVSWDNMRITFSGEKLDSLPEDK